MSIKMGYLAAIIYGLALIVFIVMYRQGVNLFWWMTPVVLISSGYLGAVWHFKRNGKIQGRSARGRPEG